jgi:UPF0755 protein
MEQRQMSGSGVPIPPPQPIQKKVPAGSKSPWFRRRKKLIAAIIGAIAALIVIVFASIAIWYTQALRPVSKDTNKYIVVSVEKGQTPGQIAQTLQHDGVIRSATAFEWYTRLHHVGGSLQFGSYRLTPSDTVVAIVKHLTSGDVDTFKITFLPGATVAQNEAVLTDAGYSQTEVDAAFNASYTGDLFQDKPAGTTLEGYMYGDTYFFNAGTSVGDILQTVFDEYTKVVQENNLVALYQSHGLTLYQGITLSSIVEREMGATGNENVPTADQKQVAQVFYLRLADGIPLGSDVTYQYAAKLLGVTPSPSLDSPYNTRIHTGLPPGPIATPSLSALLAVANPADGDYLYFLSGDDGKTYFAHTDAEHEANISAHCQQKCSQEQ